MRSSQRSSSSVFEIVVRLADGESSWIISPSIRAYSSYYGLSGFTVLGESDMGLDTVELVIQIEKELQLIFPTRMQPNLSPSDNSTGYIVETLRGQGRIESSDCVYEQLRDIICYQLGVKPKDVVPSARFVDDLGAD